MLTGHVISHYQLLGRIGRDHDVVIYRARDLTLEREVAVKVLSPAQAAQPEARERFRREARIASLVSHPHICAVHDSGEEDGVPFLVCELLEGQALDEVAAAGPLAPERLVELAIQLVDALAAVHARGLVHGSIKPSNVFITSSDHVKLLEVGSMSAWWETAQSAAPAGGSSPTASAERRMPAGAGSEVFHAYQSPEQAAGERIDHRSDIFSAGAVIYAMATGRPPFSGETPGETAAAIVAGRQVPVRRLNPSMPEVLAGVIERTLEKVPADRYQTAVELLAELRRARRHLDGLQKPPAAAVRIWRFIAVRRTAAVLLLAILIGAAAARWWWPRPPGTAARHAILIGGIANGTNDPDFDGTLRQALTVHLDQSPYLDIVSDERLRQILSMMGRPPDATLTHDVAREACQRLGLGAMLEGSVSAIGGSTSVTLVATDCASGETITRNQVEVKRKEEVLRAVGGLASSMRSSLGESVASLERHNVPIEEATTPSLDALKAYTAGIVRRAAGQEMESIPFLEHAIELDPGFSLAHTTLSSIYGGVGETDRAEHHARLAYEHRGSVSERERLFITYQFHDRVTGDQIRAREALSVWKQSYPRDYRPANALAVLLNRLGEYDRAIAEAEEAIRRNPSHSFPYSNLAYAYRGAGRYAEARETAERAVALGIETLPTRRLLYQLAELDGDDRAADGHYQWAQGRARSFDLTGARAQVLAYRGRMREARVLYARTVAEAAEGGFAEVSTGYAAQAALTEALYGNLPDAMHQARRIPGQTSYAPRLRAAAALAIAGDPGGAELIVRQLRDSRPEDTLLQAVYLPVADAAVLLERGRSDRALEVLRRVVPYERGIVAALMPVYLRGVARFQSGAYEQAAAEFRDVKQSRGADPFSPVVPLAQLGLARALVRLGDVEAARRAYDDLLATWRAADDDLRLAGQARSERAAIGSLEF
ncbi:MAG TPA: protein kinase [Vicinamibacterales bacterium]|nr:protein kinase [Vicinamibacterales bacterium]